jgi:mannose-1-phosphate guanylyltransferase
MNFAVIMAGGSGQRLWPLSRQHRPKQVLKLLDGQTLLRACFERLKGVFDLRNILVLTNVNYVELVRENLSELPGQNVIAEPAVRDTAGAIGLAAAILNKYDPKATMAVVTADQILEPADAFQKAMRTAMSFVDENPEALVTFGIRPAYPSSQLGYIKFGDTAVNADAENPVYTIEAFKEKPDEKTARQYLQSGDYYWNSGMFVWRCDTILKALKKFLPESAGPLEAIKADWGKPEQQQTLKEWFVKLPKISIDFAVMEKAAQVYGVKLECRWMDMGSFAALVDLLESDPNHNVIVTGHSELLDCKNNIIVTEEKDHLLALIGVENMIVVHSKDATLVCPVDLGHRLKELLEKIKAHHSGKFI